MANNVKRHNKLNSHNLFYWMILLYPLVQFALFYVYVNFQSIILPFQEINSNGFFVFRKDVFGNIRDIFEDKIEIVSVSMLLSTFKNTFILLASQLFIGTVFAILFSYYIYKKGFGSEVFKVVLYLPSIISSVCLTIIFKYFVNQAYPEIVQQVFNKEVVGLLSLESTVIFPTILFYTLITGFATQILLYCGSMSGIPQEMVEAAELDGCSYFEELFYITVPSVWGTITTFVVVLFAQMFVNQMNLYSFFGVTAGTDMYTTGYYLYRQMKLSATTLSNYPYLATLGVLLTLITIPVALLVNRLMKTLGPKED